jgi:hypothetical protein
MTTRPLSASERSTLEAELAKVRNFRGERLEMLLWPAVMFAGVLAGLWALLAKVSGSIFDVNIGLSSRFAPWILAIEALFFAWLMGSEVAKIYKRSSSLLRDLSADLSIGDANEQELKLVAAQRFQEPEHGGFMYFLLTTDDRVYVQFDYESQDLGVEGKAPTLSTYVPHAILKVARAPRSGHILVTEFSGAPLEITSTKVLTAKPARWPDSDTFSKVPWAKLASTYAA